MIEFDFQSDPTAFLARCGAVIARHEVEHNLILWLCESAQRRVTMKQPSGIRFYTLFRDGDFAVTALRTPPHNLVLSRGAEADVTALAERLAGEEQDIPGIVGPSDVVATFTDAWIKTSGRTVAESIDQIIYAIHNVAMPLLPEGTFRFAKDAEADLVAEWIHAFAREILPACEHMTKDESLSKARLLIAEQRLAVWDIGGAPVSMAAASGTDSMSRISFVYTPEAQRGKGYAAATVAKLSALQLKDKRICCLYADARNPVSNSIYRKIGYEFVGRSTHVVLV